MMPRTATIARPRPRRTGAAYVFVLGISLLVTVLGMGAITLSRVTQRTTTEGNDWETAGTLAYSAVEHAISFLNTKAALSPNGWRAAYTSGQTAFTQVLARGKFSWTLKDEVDGNLSADYLRPIRIYGIGTVGNVTRVYSAKVIPGGSPLPVLRTSVHSTVSLELTGKSQAANGPFSTNGNAKLSGTATGTIEAASTSGSAGTGYTVVAPSPAKALPLPTLFDNLALDATVIPYASVGDKIQQTMLTPSYNPYGAANPKGVYLIDLPAGKLFTITRCRIVGTLLLRGGAGVDVNITGPVLWEPGPLGGPILFVTSSTGKVKITGNDSWLEEGDIGLNANPPETPFNGASDAADLLDHFPPIYHGIIHVLTGGSGSVELAANVYVDGTVIADCPVKTTSMSTLLQNPATYAAPPYGYCVGDAMVLVGGSWRWDTLP